MADVAVAKSWRDELASLVEDSGIRFNGDVVVPAFEEKRSVYDESPVNEEVEVESESLKDQIEGFAKAWGEMLMELMRGCRDVVQQSLLTEESYIVKKTKFPLAEVSKRLSVLNEFLPEDRDPLHAWPVIFFVFILALSALSVNSKQDISGKLVKEVYIHPPSATRILLPDGRHMSYHEMGVPPNRARYPVIAPHGFLSSRLGGISGVKMSLLEEFGIRLVTYDLPGFGESDPHPERNLNSSALDIQYLADALGVNSKFWVLGYSSGAIHAWAAMKFIPDRVAGVALFAPFVNPYESSMTKEEMTGTWNKWTRKRKLSYFLARRSPKFLDYFYRRTFLSGKHGQIDKYLYLKLGQKDKALSSEPAFEEFWHRDVEESIRQGSTKPFIEEAALQVSNWGFSLVDLQVQEKCSGKGILSWLKFGYGQVKCELSGFLGPVHIWQGMDDQVVPHQMTDYVARILPSVVVHKLPDEGHFSYFFCEECHRKMFLTIFGSPQGSLEESIEAPTEDYGYQEAANLAMAAE
ncbi:putative mitochondrial import inner membrane translocase subunit TIM14-2-like [Capsicum annuum]|uniref:AB hydrolase-1 domain-containing protein n=1 Tax=Capsicum annuum TaxID=4072 RepID=A0A1U8E623_CAPAN|nr:uncharacterized protein LOC107843052 [Capsicum annuum]XP_047252042.1 uncharacterized protein LOC107843052 [Capsicum annuum]KAF3632714.1 putative mitochondrial import inner membrane translocase subunit TIM14-2-like [Capsicum annuum]KAF3641127.1 putative mitochondrial import inner membrane translocase subunit TIM14-2-like [Capsicum annuum]PHT71947.1 hypothetical protein T459_22732 [Capsicum annuum]